MDYSDSLLDDFVRLRNDPFEFLKIVRTKDEVDRKQSIKPFPVHFDYIRLYTKIWQKEPKLIVPKSRRMLMSWTNIALFTWDAMFHLNSNIGFVSKKEEDAADLVERSKFIIENLDHTKFPKELFPSIEPKFGVIRFPEIGSQIRGYPMGADQLRQFTFSGLLFDEFAFWEAAEKAYQAALPTLDGGGKLVIISSAAPGFMKKIVFDKLDEDLSLGEQLLLGQNEG